MPHMIPFLWAGVPLILLFVGYVFYMGYHSSHPIICLPKLNKPIIGSWRW